MSQKVVQMDLPLISQVSKREDFLFESYMSAKMRKRFEEQDELNESMKVCISFLMHDMETLERMVHQMQNTIDRLCKESCKEKDSEGNDSESKNSLGEKETHNEQKESLTT